MSQPSSSLSRLGTGGGVQDVSMGNIIEGSSSKGEHISTSEVVLDVLGVVKHSGKDLLSPNANLTVPQDPSQGHEVATNQLKNALFAGASGGSQPSKVEGPAGAGEHKGKSKLM